MIERKLKIVNKLGIHARPASMIVRTASKFDADIYIDKDGVKVSAKSIMGLMTLAASFGTVLTLSVDGDDADMVLDTFQELFASKFEEE
ncbi:MAG: HPr family phosphocarrier protein [Kiritimatiellae bacterium]|nr:HPr family phosphocarrier protein [Kiritimatiellia bacterium]